MNNKGQIVKDILLTVGTVGFIVIAGAVAPNVLQVVHKANPKRRYTKQQIKRSWQNIEKRGLVYERKKGDKTVLKLTKAGKEKVLEYSLDNIKLKPQKKWDKKWRIVIFDIPEDFKLARVTFMNKLREIGFVLVQKSVWATPYPCEDEVEFIKEVYGISNFVRLIIAESINREDNLKKSFKLS